MLWARLLTYVTGAVKNFCCETLRTRTRDLLRDRQALLLGGPGP